MRPLNQLALVILMAGCSDSTTAEAPGEDPAPSREPGVPPAPTPPEPPPEAAAGPVVEETSFELRARAADDYVVGSDATFDIALTTRAGWHVNEEYPISVKVRSPSAIQVERDELSKEDAAEFGEEEARFEVPFTAAEAGEHRVEAQVDFAVCTPETCVPDERTLSFVLPVAAGNP